MVGIPVMWYVKCSSGASVCGVLESVSLFSVIVAVVLVAFCDPVFLIVKRTELFSFERVTSMNGCGVITHTSGVSFAYFDGIIPTFHPFPVVSK